MVLRAQAQFVELLLWRNVGVAVEKFWERHKGMCKYRVLDFIVREIWILVTAKTSYLLFSSWKFKDQRSVTVAKLPRLR